MENVMKQIIKSQHVYLYEAYKNRVFQVNSILIEIL